MDRGRRMSSLSLLEGGVAIVRLSFWILYYEREVRNYQIVLRVGSAEQKVIEKHTRQQVYDLCYRNDAGFGVWSLWQTVLCLLGWAIVQRESEYRGKETPQYNPF